MRTLLITTAIALISTSSAYALPGQATEYSAQLTTSMQQELTFQLAEDLYQGDYQSIAKSTLADTLYNGNGSSLMMSIRMFRY